MAAMNEKDYYAILGVEKDATTEQIRKAFQQKARTLHPDVNKEPDAEERFKEISEAYAVLSDEGKRKRYDAMRSGSPFGGAYGNPAGTAGSGPFTYTQSYGDDPFGWGFPFGGSYTSRRTSTTQSRSYNPKEGADIVYEVTLDDETAAKGTRRGVTYQHYAVCDVCHGHGSVEHTHAVTCPTCGGKGHMSIDLSSLFGFGVMEVTCPECEGTGRVVEDPCNNCGGSGRVLTASEVVVEIPADSHDGDTVEVKGMGNAGTNGQAAGNFVCRILLPSERLTQRQSVGLGIMGFALPFIAVGFLGQGFSFNTILGCLLLAFGAMQLLQDRVSGNSRWIRNAFAALGNGMVRSLLIVGLYVLVALATPILGPVLTFVVPLMLLFMLFGRRVRF